jgi:hypothetical protein
MQQRKPSSGRKPLCMLAVFLPITSSSHLHIFYLMKNYVLFCFITRFGRPALASVPDTINCTRLITEYVHVYIISSRCDTTPGQQLQSAFFLEWGYHSRRSPIQVLTVPMLLHFCTQNRGNRCFNIVRPLAMIIIVYGSILAPPSLYPRKKPKS